MHLFVHVLFFVLHQVDEDEEEGRGQHGMFCLQRFPEDVFGDDDQKMYPITELDPAKVCTMYDSSL